MMTVDETPLGNLGMTAQNRSPEMPQNTYYHRKTLCSANTELQRKMMKMMQVENAECSSFPEDAADKADAKKRLLWEGQKKGEHASVSLPVAARRRKADPDVTVTEEAKSAEEKRNNYRRAHRQVKTKRLAMMQNGET